MIRRFKKEDLEKVRNIADISLKEEYNTELFLTIKEMWNDGFQVYEISGEIRGFICGMIIDPETVRVLMLAVHPLFRNRGIGSRLLQRFVEISSSIGIKKIVLEVRVSSKRAISFYRNRGFQITDRLKDFYTNGEDGYKMVRFL
ncbi:MAG: GNAT family N-acetyltransferase [Candidatus Thermoplasmatota archaeon]|nr:GNAT family N-acetyltransferase [Candidatus Thermoplasmatota archaeon]